MITTADFTYKRKDGGTTECYGRVSPSANYDIACANEWYDEIVEFTEHQPRTWQQVCERLEKNVNSKIEQIIAC